VLIDKDNQSDTTSLIPPAVPAPSGFRAVVQQEVTAATIDDLDSDPLFDTQLGITGTGK
jgi:uncharacterized protein YbdZ (MbtH family)